METNKRRAEEKERVRMWLAIIREKHGRRQSYIDGYRTHQVGLLMDAKKQDGVLNV